MRRGGEGREGQCEVKKEGSEGDGDGATLTSIVFFSSLCTELPDLESDEAEEGGKEGKE